MKPGSSNPPHRYELNRVGLEGLKCAECGAPLPVAVLVARTGERGGGVHALTPQDHVLGRGDDCDVRLDLAAGNVSRHHASLRWITGSFEIADRQSRNGTFVNDRRLASGETSRLDDGDVVRLGDLTLTYHELRVGVA